MFEKTGVEYGQYLMAGIFAYVVTMFLLGQKMTRLMVTLISLIYSAYVFFLITGVMISYIRASVLTKLLDEKTLAVSGAAFGTEEGYLYSGLGLTTFWLVSYIASIYFVVLVRNQKLVT